VVTKVALNMQQIHYDLRGITLENLYITTELEPKQQLTKAFIKVVNCSINGNRHMWSLQVNKLCDQK